MSKFFDQSSSSESETDSENEQVEQKAKPLTARAMTYESDEEEVKQRVVVPEKAKRLEEINNLVRSLKNAKNIKDVVKSNQIFEEMVKSYEKCKKLVEKDGHFKQYIRAIAELEVFIGELWADAEWRAAASKNNSTALSKLRQRIRKYNKEFEKELADFKLNPDSYPEEEKLAAAVDSDDEAAKPQASDKSDDDSDDDSSEDDSSEEDSDDENAKKKRTKQQKKARTGDDDEDESTDWSLSESDETSSDEDIEYNQADSWKNFLKKADDTTKDKEVTKKEKPKKKKERVAHDSEQEDAAKAAKAEKPKLFAKDEDINHESVLAKLNEICSTRGRKGTDRFEQLELLAELREIGKKHTLGPAMDVKIVFNQIAINFDYNPRLNKCMKTDNWNNSLRMLEEILDILSRNDNIEINENVTDEAENLADKTLPMRIRGCILTMTDRMCEEFVKILQQCDAHGTEYVERLKDEPKICGLIDRLQAYLERRADKQQLCRVYLKKVENTYYKYDKSNERASQELVDRLCKYIYTNDSTDRLRTKAMLCHIYHNALHDRWFEARDLMLMSHLQESIENADVPLQILYNRTMVQVGLCAFRVGNIRESHSALLDIQIGNRAKELLAQGMMVQRNVEKSKEQETKERQRLVPFHMHINLELLECVYLVSAMLIEIPYMCSRDYETKKRLISKQFHYQLKFSERQPVVGPPENMREHVVAASRAMRNGDWRACIGFLVNEKMNAKVWDLMPQSINVKQMLVEKVKEEALRTYLFRYSSVYESMSIENLALMFELPRSQVYSIISKMIINEELMASLDEPTQTIVMHRTEPTKLQTLALQLSEKITNLMDQTERMTQIKGGEMGGGFLGNRNNQQGGQQGGQQNHHQHQGGHHPNSHHRGGDHKQQNNWKGQNRGPRNQNQQNQHEKRYEHRERQSEKNY